MFFAKSRDLRRDLRRDLLEPFFLCRSFGSLLTFCPRIQNNLMDGTHSCCQAKKCCPRSASKMSPSASFVKMNEVLHVARNRLRLCDYGAGTLSSLVRLSMVSLWIQVQATKSPRITRSPTFSRLPRYRLVLLLSYQTDHSRII